MPSKDGNLSSKEKALINFHSVCARIESDIALKVPGYSSSILIARPERVIVNDYYNGYELAFTGNGNKEKEGPSCDSIEDIEDDEEEHGVGGGGEIEIEAEAELNVIKGERPVIESGQVYEKEEEGKEEEDGIHELEGSVNENASRLLSEEVVVSLEVDEEEEVAVAVGVGVTHQSQTADLPAAKSDVCVVELESESEQEQEPIGASTDADADAPSTATATITSEPAGKMRLMTVMSRDRLALEVLNLEQLILERVNHLRRTTTTRPVHLTHSA